MGEKVISMKKIKWEKNLTRNMSFLSAYYDFESHRVGYVREFSFGMTYDLWIRKGNVVFFNRTKEGFDLFKKNIRSISIEKFRRIVDKVIEFEQENKKLVKEAKDIDNNTSINELLRIFVRFDKLQRQYWPYYTVPVYYAAVLEENKDLITKEMQQKLNLIRCTGFYHDIDDIFLPKLFEILSSRMRIPVNELNYYFPDDIIDLIKENKKVSNQEIQNRKNLILLNIEGELRVLKGSEAEEFKAENFPPEKKPKIDYVSGIMSYKGDAKGKVHIVIDKEGLKGIPNGCILVTPMTTVDFMPYLSKVKGIITDEGGLTSHASVISRELKIPTLIGANIATRAFRNGDIIEINSEYGVAKKTNKN